MFKNKFMGLILVFSICCSVSASDVKSNYKRKSYFGLKVVSFFSLGLFGVGYAWSNDWDFKKTFKPLFRTCFSMASFGVIVSFVLPEIGVVLDKKVERLNNQIKIVKTSVDNVVKKTQKICDGTQKIGESFIKFGNVVVNGMSFGFFNSINGKKEKKKLKLEIAKAKEDFKKYANGPWFTEDGNDLRNSVCCLKFQN